MLHPKRIVESAKADSTIRFGSLETNKPPVQLGEEKRLGSYIYFLDQHEEMLQRSILEDKSKIVECLKSYLHENRNKLFHKDYF